MNRISMFSHRNNHNKKGGDKYMAEAVFKADVLLDDASI